MPLRIPRLAVVLFFWLAAFTAGAEGTNYICTVCGKGPLTGRIWLHPRGPLCDDCEKIHDRCALCGLPVKDGDGHILTSDGRLICKFDKSDAILTPEQAKDLFEQTREEVVDLYGRKFALKNPEVAVKLFDVDYWSEKGGGGGLHKFGFSSTRKISGGRCTHEVVLLSGRSREEMIAVAAHEYTHLWINENCPDTHSIEGDTVEAICELTAYELMGRKKLPAMQKRILENTYTHGKIKDLVAVDREAGTDYVLNWVKTGTAATLDGNASLAPLSEPAPAVVLPSGPRPIPPGLTFTGIMSFGKERLAVINGIAFKLGDQKTIKLRDRSVRVVCGEVQSDKIQVTVDGAPLSLERGGEKLLP